MNKKTSIVAQNDAVIPGDDDHGVEDHNVVMHNAVESADKGKAYEHIVEPTKALSNLEDNDKISGNPEEIIEMEECKVQSLNVGH